MSGGPLSVLRYCAKTKQLEVYERWFAILWRVPGFRDDWRGELGWVKNKKTRALYSTRGDARAAMPGPLSPYQRRRIKLVRIFRRVT